MFASRTGVRDVIRGQALQPCRELTVDLSSHVQFFDATNEGFLRLEDNRRRNNARYAELPDQITAQTQPLQPNFGTTATSE